MPDFSELLDTVIRAVTTLPDLPYGREALIGGAGLIVVAVGWPKLAAGLADIIRALKGR